MPSLSKTARTSLKSLFGIVGSLAIAAAAHAQTTTCFDYEGTIRTWTVPPGVNSVIAEARGAKGGDSAWNPSFTGGLGASMKGTFAVNPGDELRILVGGEGETGSVGGGGGASFLATSGNAPLLAAGGGGGASSDQNGVDAVITEDGTPDGGGVIAGGTGGNGGSACLINNNSGGGGGGFFTDGVDATDGIAGDGGFGGKAFVNGGAIVPGGRLDDACNADPAGGFGGGGSASCNTVGGGGGGGYSGGGGGRHIFQCGADIRTGGGGGGSFNAGTDQMNTAGVGTGHGEVCLTTDTVVNTLPQNLACARDGINALAANEVMGPAQQNLMVGLINLAEQYFGSPYTFLSLNALNSVIARTNGCPLRGSPDSILFGASEVDFITQCGPQGPIHTCLQDARTQMME